MKNVLHLLAFVVSITTFGQNKLINGFAFDMNPDVFVEENNKVLPLAWVGGLNYTSHVNIDFNSDGNLDVLVFDKDGSRMLPFISEGTGNTHKLKYAPEYKEFLPKAHHWIITADYNCDGKLDLFVGIDQKIKVYENQSSSSEFKLVPAHTTAYVKSVYNGFKTDLASAATDIPGIIDLDDDGDLDILTVNGVGVDAHINNTNCGLDFIREAECWGLFQEVGNANNVTLNACDGVSPNYTTAKTNATMHAGGAMLALDLNGDNLKDLLISDVSYENVVALYNNGKLDSAVMGSKDTTFPSNNPAQLYLYPAMSYADANGDGKNDLILSPNETNVNSVGGGSVTTGSENVNNTLLYTNSGTNGSPTFNFSKRNFLQEDMIDMGEGAIPRFVDLNGDGLQDLVLANHGEFISPAVYSTYFRYYQNIGNQDSVAFRLIDGDFAQMSSYNIGRGIIPAFGDLDNDGDQDMVVGDEDGKLHFFRNTGNLLTPTYSLATAGIGGFDVGSNAAPFLFDVNGDSTLDLVVGNAFGTLSYFSNGSTISPSFTLVTNTFGGARVRSTISGQGRAVPYLFADSLGTINLMVGSEKEGIWQYDSLGTQIGSTGSTEYQFGNDSILTTTHIDSPLGVKKRNGRNQMLITAAELKAMGVGFGYIDAIHFYCIINPVLITPVVQKGFEVQVGMVANNDLTNGFEGGLETIQNDDRHYFSNGWNRVDLKTPFLYDGKSSLVVQICFSGNLSQNADIHFRQTDVGFAAAAFGNANTANHNDIDYKGCTMPLHATSNLRPNMKLELSPAFANTSNILNTGNLTAAAFADVNNDGFIDAVVGNYAGGVEFFMGKKYVNTVGLQEPNTVVDAKTFSVYPNPGNGAFYIARENAEKAILKVYTINGALVLQKSLTEKNTEINLDNMPSGLYIFGVENQNGFTTQKVIKQ